MRQVAIFSIQETLANEVNYGSLIDGCSIRGAGVRPGSRFTAWPGTGEIENIIVWMDGTNSVGNGWTLDLLVEGIVRATETVTGATTQVIIDGPIPVVAGQIVLIRMTPVGTPANSIAEVAWEFIGTTPKQSVYGASADTIDLAIVDYRGGPGAIRPWDNTLTPAESITPINGMFTSLWASVFVDGLAGVGNYAGTIAFVINGVVQDGTGGTIDTVVDIAAVDPGSGLNPTIFSKTGFELPVVRGDRIAVTSVPGAGPYSTTNIGASMTFVADDDGYSIIASTPNNNLSALDTQYNPPGNPDNVTWFDTEVYPRVNRGNVSTFELGLAITRLTVAPETGSARMFDIRQNLASTPIAFTISDTAVVGEDIVNTAIIMFGDTWAWQHVPYTTPFTSKSLLAISAFIAVTTGGGTTTPPGPAASFSGIYQMVPGKTNDTVFTDVDNNVTVVLKIPDPFIITGPIGE